MSSRASAESTAATPTTISQPTLPNPQHTAACRGGPMCPPNDHRSYRIRKGGGSKGRKWQGRSKCKISGNMSFRHWADTRVRPYRRVMYAEYDNRDMYVYEISHPSPLTSKKLMFNKKIIFLMSTETKKNTWKLIIQLIVSIATAIATTLGVTSCMGANVYL